MRFHGSVVYIYNHHLRSLDPRRTLLARHHRWRRTRQNLHKDHSNLDRLQRGRNATERLGRSNSSAFGLQSSFLLFDGDDAGNNLIYKYVPAHAYHNAYLLRVELYLQQIALQPRPQNQVGASSEEQRPCHEQEPQGHCCHEAFPQDSLNRPNRFGDQRCSQTWFQILPSDQ